MAKFTYDLSDLNKLDYDNIYLIIIQLDKLIKNEINNNNYP
jgi:hypothetical protein